MSDVRRLRYKIVELTAVLETNNIDVGCIIPPTRDCQAVITRCISTNGKNLLANPLTNFDWSVLAAIADINFKVLYFNNCVNALLNIFLPVQVVKRRQSDKPRITDRFRRLIRCRQRAWTSGDQVLYNRLRNQVSRLFKQLRTQF
jgi:hypothetical protein